MKSLLFAAISLLLFLSSLLGSPAYAQENDRNLILASDLVNTTLNGAMLGSAVMGLQNSTEYKDPLRIGVGLGMLAGVGLAAYDLIQLENGRDLVHGTFISGNNSSVVLIIDTIYGAVAGSVIGTAIILVANEPLTDGLQYGASLGAWAGFGFGLLDTFVLSRNRTMSPMGGQFDSAITQHGLFSRPGVDLGPESRLELDFLKPELTRTASFNSPSGGFSGTYVPRPVLNVLELNLRF